MSMTLELEGGGRIRFWEEGARVFFRCERELSTDGIYKVWLRGDEGGMLLGALVPEGGMLRLCRTLSVAELRRCGCWPVRGARCVMAYSFGRKNGGDGWYWEEDPGRFVDRETRMLGEWSRMLCRKIPDGTELAYPVRGNTPIQLVHLFCLAQLRQVRGEMCLVWRFSADGTPSFPKKIGC